MSGKKQSTPLIMSNTNTPPLYAMTPIDQTEGLEDNKPVYGMYQFANMKHLMDSKITHYLLQLPEGTRVLKPGEVAVSEEELCNLIWEGVNMYGNAMYIIEERVKQFIQTKLAQMGE